MAAVLRNLAAMKNIKSKVIEWTLIILGAALGIVFNNRGLVGWLPIAANLVVAVTTAISLIMEKKMASSAEAGKTGGEDGQI